MSGLPGTLSMLHGLRPARGGETCARCGKPAAYTYAAGGPHEHLQQVNICRDVLVESLDALERDEAQVALDTIREQQELRRAVSGILAQHGQIRFFGEAALAQAAVVLKRRLRREGCHIAPAGRIIPPGHSAEDLTSGGMA